MHDEPRQAPHKRFSRRILIAGAGIAAGGAAGGAARSAVASDSSRNGRKIDTWIAKQEIAELRRLYARATDLIGMVTDASIAEGRAIYHRIFTSSARIDAGIDPAFGPDAWVDVVISFLTDYVATQHLIGTQLVDLVSLPDAQGQGGEASMKSYVQAWHATDDEVWTFIGMYSDKLTHSKDAGWQINEMMLEQISSDRRPLGAFLPDSIANVEGQ